MLPACGLGWQATVHVPRTSPFQILGGLPLLCNLMKVSSPLKTRLYQTEGLLLETDETMRIVENRGGRSRTVLPRRPVYCSDVSCSCHGVLRYNAGRDI